MSDGFAKGARMTAGRTPAAYSMTILHWVTAGLVLILLPLGAVIANAWGGPLQIPSMICTARSAP
jgi:hypothetical protein